MKKATLILLSCFSLLSLFVLCAQSPAYADIVGISARAEVNTVYHQIATLFIEYDENVIAPAKQDFTIIDYATAKMKEDYDRRPSSQAPIVAVYTNDKPELRAGKDSVDGKYIVIEIEPTTRCIEEGGIMKPNHNAGLCTWRLEDEQCEWRRNDFSEFAVTQNVDILSAAGDVVAAAGRITTLDPAGIYTPHISDHKQMTIKNKDGYDIHFSLYLPPNYDRSKSYPMVYNVAGNGGRLNYLQTDNDGNLRCIGANVTRDGVAIALTQMGRDVIVVSPQIWRNEPEEWNIDYVADSIRLIEHVFADYAVDQSRAYAIGSSFGTMHISSLLTTRADLISAYIMCNGAFQLRDGAGFLNIFKDEYNGILDGKDIEYVESFGPETRLDRSEYYDSTKTSLGGIVEKRLPIWIYHGVNDETLPVTNAVSTYEVLRELYVDAGLTESEINDLTHLTLLNDETFFSIGVAERHQASKLVVGDSEIMSWMFSQKTAEAGSSGDGGGSSGCNAGAASAFALILTGVALLVAKDLLKTAR